MTQHTLYPFQFGFRKKYSSTDDLIYLTNWKSFDSEVAIEPHSSFSKSKSWVEPLISSVIEGTLQILKLKDEPVQIQKIQNIGQRQPVIIPGSSITQAFSCESPIIPKSYPAVFSTTISFDPDGMLSFESRNKFRDIAKRFQSVFNSTFGIYNNKSCPICANINLGPAEPPTQKGKLLFNNQTNLRQLQ